MKPIPDDVEPVPSNTVQVVALADAGSFARADAAVTFAELPHASKPPACADSRHRPLEVRRLSADEWIVASGVLEVVRSERKAILSPRVDASGKVIGLEVRDIGEGSCLGSLGFQNGDVIRSINSYVLGADWSAYAAIMGSINKSGEAVVRFDRSGRPMTVVYEVQGG